jgi:hypothetical protein
VAYYLQSIPGQVTALRQRGIGYGDVVVVLAAARSENASPSLLAERLAPGASPLDSLKLSSEQAVGLETMLTFLTRAMLREVGIQVGTELSQ